MKHHRAYVMRHRWTCDICAREWKACEQSFDAWGTARGYVSISSVLWEWLIPRGLVRGVGGRVNGFAERSILVDPWVAMVLRRAIVASDKVKAQALRYYARHPRARKAFEVAAALGLDEIGQAQIITDLVERIGEQETREDQG